jgi:hypothetical protein
MATTAGFKRVLAGIITAMVAVAATAKPAKADGGWMPLLPDQDFYDFQLFAPPDLDSYNVFHKPHDGIFFNYDRLYWATTVPDVVGVGQTQNGSYIIPIQPISPQTIVQLNNANLESGDVIGGLYIFGGDVLNLDLNTSWMRTKMSWGNRFEGGWVYDNRGMMFSYFDSGEQGQSFSTLSEFAASSPQQFFTQSTATGEAQQGGTALPATTTTITSISPPPDHIIAQKLTQENTTRIQSAGFAAVIRRQIGGRTSRSSARFGLGPRFIQLEDRYALGYESNQYPFDVGTNAAGGSVSINGNQTGGTGGGTGGAQGGTGGSTQVGTTQLNTSLGSAGDVLSITGVDSLTGRGTPSPLQTGDWETYTMNNMVGPEISLLLETQSGRWTFSSEMKFVAAMNWQNNLYRGANFPESLGADFLRTTFTPSTTLTTIDQGTDPVTLTPPPLFLQIYGTGQTNATNNAEHTFVFSPIGEWRFGAQYRVSQAVLLRAGYTGMWMAGIARASSNTGYESVARPVQTAVAPPPGSPPDAPWTIETRDVNYNRITARQNANEYVFTNGIDFGVEIKY